MVAVIIRRSDRTSKFTFASSINKYVLTLQHISNYTPDFESENLPLRNSVKKYSAFTLVRNALSYHEKWPQMWRSPEPKQEYEVIIVGAGGHGLATAYYLAREYGINKVAVLERAWLGGGSTGRNTEIVRSNYLWDESSQLYEKSLQLWEGLSQELNYNVMFSQRGVFNWHTRFRTFVILSRRVHAKSPQWD